MLKPREEIHEMITPFQKVSSRPAFYVWFFELEMYGEQLGKQRLRVHAHV